MSKDVSNARPFCEMSKRSSRATSKSKKGKTSFSLISRTREKIILREDKLINAPTGAPLRGGRVLAPAYPRVSLSAESTAADEKLISPRCDAHELIFARVKEICDRRIFLTLNEYATSISLPMLPLPRCLCEGESFSLKSEKLVRNK